MLKIKIYIYICARGCSDVDYAHLHVSKLGETGLGNQGKKVTAEGDLFASDFSMLSILDIPPNEVSLLAVS